MCCCCQPMAMERKSICCQKLEIVALLVWQPSSSLQYTAPNRVLIIAYRGHHHHYGTSDILADENIYIYALAICGGAVGSNGLSSSSLLQYSRLFFIRGHEDRHTLEIKKLITILTVSYRNQDWLWSEFSRFCLGNTIWICSEPAAVLACSLP